MLAQLKRIILFKEQASCILFGLQGTNISNVNLKC